MARRSTAAQAFKEHLTAANSKLELLKCRLKEYAEDQKRYRDNWGYAGSPARVNELLDEIDEFITGRG